MNKKYLLALLVALGSIFLMHEYVMTNSGTPPLARTGAPGESMCNGCHTGTAVTTGGIIDFAGGATEYVPTKTYTITLTGENGTKNGFEMVVLKDGVNTNIGTLSNATSNSKTSTSAGRTYFHHNIASSNNSWTIDWTAPSSDVGTVTVYAIFNKANSNSSSTGDAIYTNTLTISSAVVCSTDMFTLTPNTIVLLHGTDGSADVAVSGGNAPYSFSWNNGATDSVASNLGAGAYVVTITDGYGCDTTTALVVSEPDSITISLTNVDNASCFGLSDGSVTVTVTGGTPPYNIVWSNGDTGITANDLSAGSIDITVTDNKNCLKVETFPINEPSEIVIIEVAKSDATCGSSDGSIAVSVSSDSPGYSYSWSNGAIDSVNTGLASGTYTVTVTDAGGCSNNKSFGISDIGGPVIVLVDSNHVSCNGLSDGWVRASASSGVAPYSYSWNTIPVQTDSVATGLSAGDYILEVTGSNTCKSTTSITIEQPEVISLATSLWMVSCNGDDDGSSSVTATGGTQPYSYVWNTSPVQTGMVATALSVGTYTVTVLDINDCQSVTDVTITEPEILNISIDNKSNVSCYGDDNGSIDISVTGGTTSYSYSWSNGATSQNISDLSEGDYDLVVTDVKGCKDSISRGISQPDSLMFAFSSTPEVGDNDGSITVSVFGGTTPYQYMWSNGDSTAMIANLDAGMFTLTVIDANGCMRIESDTVDDNTAIEDMFLKDHIRIFPNPAVNTLNIVIGFDDAEDINISITNLIGERVYEINDRNIYDKKYTISIDKLSSGSGIYFVEIKSKDQSVTKKIMFR